jgi:DNA-directed RNA polymerase subunit M/transcription elongation factor TFIIS
MRIVLSEFSESHYESVWGIYVGAWESVELTFLCRERPYAMRDLVSDPTLPRTKEADCPKCGHNEAVFFRAETNQNDKMWMYYVCLSCRHRWKD